SHGAGPPAAPVPPARTVFDGERAVLDRLPIGVIVHRNDRVLYANRTLLDWLGIESAQALAAEGGIGRLFTHGHGVETDGEMHGPIVLRGRGDEPIPIEARLVSAPWDSETALVYVLQRAGA